ncbi:MAG: PfkB family carbohydrate kinase [Bacteroidales bacterium]|nr:PfkB family carbohydrate kinase [Bacteroidales bacterium]
MNKEQIHQLFEQFSRFNILIIGDVMIDTYFWGKVDRISPEAPVPIIARTNIEHRLGGAGNVALNVQSLGATPYLCSVIGDDDKSNILTKLLRKRNLPSAGILQDKDRITTIKTRIISDNQHLLRIDEEITNNIPKEIQQKFIRKIQSLIEDKNINAIIFEDYDKGVITPEIIEETVKIAKRKNIPTLVDPKKRNFMDYHGVSLFKPNFKELVEGLKLDIEKSNFVTFNKALDYMGFSAGEEIVGKDIDYVFVGSCTNGRIEDLREVASFVKGRKKADNVTAWIVPGSKQVEQQANQEGITKILEDAGFKLRQPGCSACLAMNDDKIPTGMLAVATSNRNFEGRQGPGSRTMLASPLTAAAVAISGKIVYPRTLL